MEQKDGILIDKKIPFKVMLKRTYSYVRPEIKYLLLAFLFIIFNVAIDVITPIIVKILTDNLKDPVHISMSVILWASLGSLALSFIAQGFRYIESMVLTKSGQRIVYKLRMEVFSHIESMSQNQFNEMPVGSLVTRVANYTASMSDFYTNVLVSIIRNILTVISVYIIMIVISPLLSLFLSGFVIVVFISSYIFSKNVKIYYKKARNNLSSLNTFLNESLQGMRIIQMFNQEKRSDETFVEKNETYRKSQYRITILFALYRPFISLIYICAIVVTYYAGTKLGLSSGEIVAFYLFLSRFFNPVQELADQLNNIQRTLTDSGKLFNLLDIPPEVMDEPDAIEIDSFKGKIEFKNVWFAYNDDDWILKDVSFIIEPKQTVAFVGATGAGKTTILGLMVRNFVNQKGQVLIDDIDIRHIKIKSLRKCIGQMLQDVFLFSGTIKENVTLFDDNYSDEEVMSACEYVHLSSLINSLPKKLDEPVIEKGDNFSTGQRQLLSFARTVLHKPQIMILDEATANIDTETEIDIQKSLEAMRNIGTMLVVAHRLSTIQHADKILVLNHGVIIEQGNHQDLLKQKGYYYKLYTLQFEGK